MSVHSFQTLRRSTESVLRKREQKLARISILIVIIFIICHSLKNIPTLFEIFGKDPRVSWWKHDDGNDVWRVIKYAKDWLEEFLFLHIFVLFLTQGRRGRKKTFINVEIFLASSSVLSNSPHWPSSFEHQQQHQLPCLQFWKQQEDI